MSHNSEFWSYDVASDGGFVMAEGEEKLPRQIDVVLNWFDEVKRRAPAK